MKNNIVCDMRKPRMILIFCCLYFTVSPVLFGQNPVKYDLTVLESEHQMPEWPIFLPNQNALPDQPIAVNTQQAMYLQNIKPAGFQTKISYLGKMFHLWFKKSDAIHPDLTVTDSDGVKHFLPNAVYYHGMVRGRDKSMATLSVINGKMRLWVSTDELSFEVNFIERAYIVSTASALHKNKISCLTEEGDLIHHDRPNVGRASFADCVDVFLETDYELYLAHGSNLPALIAWYTNVFNDVALIYDLSGVPIYMNDVSSNTVPDGYPVDLVGSLNQFVTNWPSFNGVVAFLMSGKTLGGGISQGVGGYCNSPSSYPGPYAIAGDMTVPYVGYPTYSYNVMIVAHELGHVMGLRHTHACVWYGNNSQIDDCGNVYADQNGMTPEGLNCFDPDNPLLPGNDGTIMSFCHLLGNTAINLTEGFGPEGQNILYHNFINAPCITGTQCRFLEPTNDLCVDALPYTLTNTCIFKTYDNKDATASGELPNFACGNQGAGLDVWFQIEIPSSGSVTIETGQAAGGLTDMVLQTYSGTCGSLVLELCDDNSGSGNHAMIQLTGRTPGEIIYVRVIENGSDEEGEFDFCAYDASLPCHPDFTALVDFYNEMGGPSWFNNTGWIDGAANNDCNICSWYGVICNPFGRVIELNLEANNLTGPLSDALVQLDLLNKISLFSNAINDTVPAFLKDLPLLEFVDLGSNQLTGSLTPFLGDAPNLRTLYLDNNLLNGVLPPGLSIAPLTNLWLNDNDFSGCLPNEYTDFCDRAANVRLYNNPLLPFGGDYAQLCADSLGADFDMDGFCGGSPDCLDTDPNTYPGAPELCDGIDNDCDMDIDEGLPAAANNWLGVDSDWNNPANWSEGITPKSCHDVNIDPISMDSSIIFALSDFEVASVYVGPNATLHIQNFSSLTMSGNSVTLNDGKISLHGTLNIEYPVSSNPLLTNNNILEVGGSGIMTLEGIPTVGLLNSTTATITNAGEIVLDSTLATGGMGLVNLGFISNEGLIQTLRIDSLEFVLLFNSNFLNLESGTIEAR